MRRGIGCAYLITTPVLFDLASNKEDFSWQFHQFTRASDLVTLSRSVKHFFNSI